MMNYGNEYHFLLFSRKEKYGIVLLILINLALAFLPNIYARVFHDPLPDQSILLKASAKLIELEVDSPDYGHHQKQNFSQIRFKEKEIEKRRFVFDPNTINDQQWKDLGVNEKTIRTIRNYLSKGGRFKKPDDIQKIWGLSPSGSAELIPWVKVASATENASTLFHESSYHSKFQAIKLIDINTADSALFESLPGIGPSLARRIILFRNKLGGFYSIQQLSEVWGLQDSVFQKIKNRLDLKNGNIKKIDINAASIEQMKSHPYVGYKIALSIENYRKQHGPYHSLEEIQQLPQMDEKTYNKIIHYLVATQ